MRRTVCAWLLVLAPSAALAGPVEDALAAYDKFFSAFRTNNQDEITTLFAPDAQFYGTSSPDVVTTTEGIRKYFSAALAGARGDAKATPFERSAVALSDSVVIVAGKWQSERTLDGKMTTAGPSRNSVVMQKRGDQWVIVQFHNSPVPKPAQAAPPSGR